MLRFFRKKPAEASPGIQDWSFLHTDIHSHFIPGIDDGPQAMEDSLALLKSMEQAGFSRVITTPHISLDYFPDTEAGIESGLLQLKTAAREAGIQLELEAAAEYMIDESLLEKLHTGRKLFAIGGKYILIEMGFVQVSPMLQQVIFEIQAAGYVPVLAHPERYNYYQDIPVAALKTLKQSGCLFQLNTISLSGYYGKHVKILAEKLLKECLYDFAGSDIHHQRHVKALNMVLQSEMIYSLLKYPFLNNKI